MTTGGDQELLRDLMVRYVLGDLNGRQAAAFERQLAADLDLAAEVASLQRTLNVMPYAVEAEPPQHLRAAVLRAARLARRPQPTTSRRWAWVSSPMLTAAAALLAIVLGADSYRLRREMRLHQDVTNILQQPNVVLSFSMSGTGDAGGAFGSVLLDLDGKRAGVVIRNLPALPADTVYRLWALVGDKHVPCGQFTANADGTVQKQLVIPVDAYTEPVTKLVLTRETNAQAAEPTGPTVMVSS